jgi:hypothetical protein
VDYVRHIYDLITKYVEFLGYKANELFYGVETPISTIEKINNIENQVNNQRPDKNKLAKSV